jgi:hypothetical protein
MPYARSTGVKTGGMKVFFRSGQIASIVKCNPPVMSKLMTGHFKVLTNMSFSFSFVG